MDKPGICRLLDTVTTGMRLVFRQILIYTDGLLSFIDLHPEVFVQLPVIFHLHGGLVSYQLQFVVFPKIHLFGNLLEFIYMTATHHHVLGFHVIDALIGVIRATADHQSQRRVY